MNRFPTDSLQQLNLKVISYLKKSWWLIIILFLFFISFLYYQTYQTLSEKSDIWWFFFSQRVLEFNNSLSEDLSKYPPNAVSAFVLSNSGQIIESSPSYLENLFISNSILFHSIKHLKKGDNLLLFHPDFTDGTRTIFFVRKYENTSSICSFRPEIFFPFTNIQDIIITVSKSDVIQYSTESTWIGNKVIAKLLLLYQDNCYLTQKRPLPYMENITLSLHQNITLPLISTSFVSLLLILTFIVIAYKSKSINSLINRSSNEIDILKKLSQELSNMPTLSHQNFQQQLITIEKIFEETDQKYRSIEWTFYETGLFVEIYLNLLSEIVKLVRSISHYSQALADKMAELNQFQELLQNVINSMPSALIGVDKEHTVTLWNQEAENLLSISLEDAVNTSVDEIPFIAQNVGEYLSEAMKKQRVIEIEIIPKLTHQEVYSLQIYPLKEENVISGTVIIISNITAEKKLRAQLQQSQKMEAIGQLAGGVAHDFNNMLSGIIGASELLSESLTSDQNDLLDIILTASQSAAELTQKLLNFSRKGKIESAPINVHQAVEEAIALLQRSINKKIVLEQKLLASNSIVVGDLSQLQNVFLNLGINASHAMKESEGEILYKTDVIELDETYCEVSPFTLTPGSYIVITINDTGSGISPENLQKVFEPFFTTKGQGQGTGLGLAAVYASVEQHKGAITVYSEVGEGTTFNIYLPLSSHELPISQKKIQHITGEGTILVIDDEKIVRMMADRMLQKLGYTVFLASNCREGVEVYRKHASSIDLVILDVIMPEIDGCECFRMLRKEYPTIQIVLSSGYTKDANITQLREEGLVDFLPKPYSISELSSTVHRAMHNEI